MIIRVITEATGIVTKVERKILKPNGFNGFNGFPKKTAILGTSHIRGKVLQCETGSLSSEDHHLFKRRSTREKRPVTRDNTIIILILILILTNNNNNNSSP